MRYLGIDYGKKRIGVAVSDEKLGIAFPRGIIENRGITSVARELQSFIKKENIARLIVGLPVGIDGRETDQTKEVRMFVERLQKEIFIPLVFENEMLTTRIAREKTVKEMLDVASAALILQSYLDKSETRNDS